MAQTVRFRLADDAADALTALRDRLGAAGMAVPAGRPAVTVAAAVSIPPAARAALAGELRVLALPALWLAGLGTVAGRDDELVLSAIVDGELLAVHAAVHDALAGRVRGPVAAYLPGAWLPHCVLATTGPADGFALLHPLPPIRASVVGVEIADSRTGTVDPLP
jgi:hypothetical protein